MENHIRPKSRPYDAGGGGIGWEFTSHAKAYARSSENDTQIWIPFYPSSFRRKEGAFVRVTDREEAKAYVYLRYDDPDEARNCWECTGMAFDFRRKYRL